MNKFERLFAFLVSIILVAGIMVCAVAEENYASRVAEQAECDILVVGAGMSGISAATEALNHGAKVIVLESQARAGGNGTVTSCVMGVGTRFQEALGISVTSAEILNTEMETFNYSVDGTRWASLIQDSSDNIDWLIEQGALMRDDFVDNYGGTGVVPTAHWWVGTTGRDGNNGFVEPMIARIEALGGKVMYQTPGKQLITDESGAVIGVYAEGENGVIEIRAKAVILATGGFANNVEMVEAMGYNYDNTAVFGMPGHNGDGIRMALEVGGKSWLDHASLMEYPMNPALGMPSMDISQSADMLWVNGRGERYVNENCAEAVPARAALAVRAQEASFTLFDENILEQISGGDDQTLSMVSKAVESGAIYRADSISDLAHLAGIDEDKLESTVLAYNEACKQGEDTIFGKDASHLIAIENGPFYLNPNGGILFLTTIGGIETTFDCEVRAAEGGVVANLYAVGVDGVMNYNGLYTIDVPGSCNANNIWSGRHAAQVAVSRLSE